MLLESQRDKTQGDANEFCQGQIISQSRLAENHLISVFLPSVSYYPRPTKQSTDAKIPLLFLQVCNHRLSVAQSVAQSLGWHVIHCSRHVGTGPKERHGHLGGLMVKSPNGAK